MKKNFIYLVAILALIFTIVGQAAAGGYSNGSEIANGIAARIAAKENRLRKSLMRQLKRAARKAGLRNIDASSLVAYTTPDQYVVAASTIQVGSGVLAVAYFDTEGLNGLFAIRNEVTSSGDDVFVYSNISTNEEFRIPIERTIVVSPDGAGESVAPIFGFAINPSSSDERWHCWVVEEGPGVKIVKCVDIDLYWPF